MTITKSKPIERLQVRIGGMQCSFCVESIRKAYHRMEGVTEVSVSLSHEEALIRYDPQRVTATKLRDTLRGLGFTVRDPNKLRSFEEEAAELRHHKRQFYAAATVTLFAAVLMLARWTGFGQPWFPLVMLNLTLLMMFGIGWPIIKMAFSSLRRGIFNQHVLMEFGAFGGLIGGLIGFVIQPWPIADFMGAAIFITGYHILSGYVSMLVRTRSSQAIRRLMELQPATSRVLRNGVEQELPIEMVQKGDHVRVRPGESIPVDGKVIDGSSAVDQSLVTGEPIPVVKLMGDEVIGGSINQQGSLLVEVTKVGEESFLYQVAMSIQEARALKPGILMAVEKVLKFFVPGVLLAAALGFFIWTVGAWIIIGEPNFTRAIFATLAALVMGYPCGLGMATPLAMIRGGGIAAQQGILMRSGEAFQVFKDVKIVVLDKTGTITEGRPNVVKVIAMENYDLAKVVSLAASAEHASEHPLARAIVEYAESNGYLEKLSTVDGFQAFPGFGVKATINNRIVTVGSPRFLGDENIDLNPIRKTLETMEEGGWTVVAVAETNNLVGLIAIADTLKKDAKEAISRMKSVGMEPILVTGDNARTANVIARKVGISKIMAEALPSKKAEIVRELQRKGYRVAMVGDGINDAPALMQADVGIAIGAGTDIAIESADVILVNNQLMGVIDAYHIGKNSFRKTTQNVLLAFAFNGIGVPLAITGLVHPVFAMLAMAASVTTVLLNSFGGKLLPKKRPKDERKSQSLSKITFHIPTIHCDGCIKGLKEALSELPGVTLVEGNIENKTLSISYGETIVTSDTLQQTISQQGHKVASQVKDGKMTDLFVSH
jgi:heavy metal translocating P-type ATPase